MCTLPQQGRKRDGAPGAPWFTLRFKVQSPAKPEPSFGVQFRWKLHLTMNLVHEVCKPDHGQSSVLGVVS